MRRTRRNSPGSLRGTRATPLRRARRRSGGACGVSSAVSHAIGHTIASGGRSGAHGNVATRRSAMGVILKRVSSDNSAPPSLYGATGLEVPISQTAQWKDDVDVAIVGGGITGLWAA